MATSVADRVAQARAWRQKQKEDKLAEEQRLIRIEEERIRKEEEEYQSLESDDSCDVAGTNSPTNKKGGAFFRRRSPKDRAIKDALEGTWVKRQRQRHVEGGFSYDTTITFTGAGRYVFEQCNTSWCSWTGGEEDKEQRVVKVSAQGDFTVTDETIHFCGKANKEKQLSVSKEDEKTRKSALRSRSSQRLHRLFNEMDEDHSGSVDFHEFVLVLKSDNMEKMHALFDLLDEDGGGTLDAEELTDALMTNPEARKLASEFEVLAPIVQAQPRRYELAVVRTNSYESFHSLSTPWKQFRKEFVKQKRIKATPRTATRVGLASLGRPRKSFSYVE